MAMTNDREDKKIKQKELGKNDGDSETRRARGEEKEIQNNIWKEHRLVAIVPTIQSKVMM